MSMADGVCSGDFLGTERAIRKAELVKWVACHGF